MYAVVVDADVMPVSRREIGVDERFGEPVARGSRCRSEPHPCDFLRHGEHASRDFFLRVVMDMLASAFRSVMDPFLERCAGGGGATLMASVSGLPER